MQKIGTAIAIAAASKRLGTGLPDLDNAPKAKSLRATMAIPIATIASSASRIATRTTALASSQDGLYFHHRAP